MMPYITEDKAPISILRWSFVKVVPVNVEGETVLVAPRTDPTTPIISIRVGRTSFKTRVELVTFRRKGDTISSFP